MMYDVCLCMILRDVCVCTIYDDTARSSPTLSVWCQPASGWRRPVLSAFCIWHRVQSDAIIIAWELRSSRWVTQCYSRTRAMGANASGDEAHFILIFFAYHSLDSDMTVMLLCTNNGRVGWAPMQSVGDFAQRSRKWLLRDKDSRAPHTSFAGQLKWTRFYALLSRRTAATKNVVQHNIRECSYEKRNKYYWFWFGVQWSDSRNVAAFVSDTQLGMWQFHTHTELDCVSLEQTADMGWGDLGHRSPRQPQVAAQQARSNLYNSCAFVLGCVFAWTRDGNVAGDQNGWWKLWVRARLWWNFGTVQTWDKRLFCGMWIMDDIKRILWIYRSFQFVGLLNQ